jgi:hypothetical protein
MPAVSLPSWTKAGQSRVLASPTGRCPIMLEVGRKDSWSSGTGKRAACGTTSWLSLGLDVFWPGLGIPGSAECRSGSVGSRRLRW